MTVQTESITLTEAFLCTDMTVYEEPFTGSNMRDEENTQIFWGLRWHGGWVR